MTTSSYLAAKQYLVAALRADAFLSAPSTTPGDPGGENGVVTAQVCYSTPGVTQSYDLIVLGRTSRQMAPTYLVGNFVNPAFDESYTLEVHCDVFRRGDFPEIVDARAFAVAEGVIQVVRATPDLGGLVIQIAPSNVEHGEPDWVKAPADGAVVGRSARHTVTLTVSQNRI